MQLPESVAIHFHKSGDKSICHVVDLAAEVVAFSPADTLSTPESLAACREWLETNGYSPVPKLAIPGVIWERRDG